MPIDTRKTRRRIENALRQRGSDEDLLREFAGMLGVEVEMLPEVHHCHCCDDGRRPSFGSDQVRCPCQLVKGETYYAVHLENRTTRFTVLREPYEEDGGWWIDVHETHLHPFGFTHKIRRSLVDASVVPHDDGSWADENHFSFTEKSGSCCSHRSCGRRRGLNPLSWTGGNKHSHCCHHHHHC